jgi:hypothetical protein
MTRDEIRQLVQQLVADRLRDRAVAAAAPLADHRGVEHASHAVYVTLVNTGDSCVIEPHVPCTHCNYCKSHGH